MTRFLAMVCCSASLLGCNAPSDSAGETDLIAAMAYGRILEINTQQPTIDKSLWLRLYEIPGDRRDCRPEIDAPCSYRYLLSVSTFDEHPHATVLELREVAGQVQSVSWLPETEVDRAKLGFEVTPYDKDAAESNAALVNTPFSVLVNVTPESVQEARSPTTP